MNLKLIVALDLAKQEQALALVEQLDPKLCALKVGSEMFSLFGPDFVRRLIQKGFKVFLDLKFHDIPNTVSKACRACGELGVWMLNVHASGGFAMMQAARAALEEFGTERPLLIAVTVLTSIAPEDLSAIGIKSNLENQVDNLARLTLEAGLDGVVSSAQEVAMIKKSCGQSFLTVTPGIRLLNDPKDDQTRITTPAKVIEEGSDFLVIGRPITAAKEPAKVIEEILAMIRV